MSNPIAPAGAFNPMAPGATGPAAGTPEARAADLHRVASEFEAMLLRQLLSASKVGRDAGGYSEMAVDALANGISQAGGVGLTRQLEAALGGQLAPAPAGRPTPAGEPGTISGSSSAGGGRSGDEPGTP